MVAFSFVPAYSTAPEPPRLNEFRPEGIDPTESVTTAAPLFDVLKSFPANDAATLLVAPRVHALPDACTVWLTPPALTAWFGLLDDM